MRSTTTTCNKQTSNPHRKHIQLQATRVSASYALVVAMNHSLVSLAEETSLAGVSEELDEDDDA